MTRRPAPTHGDPDALASLADRLEFLFWQMYPRSRGRAWTTEEAVETIRDQEGTTIGVNFLNALRSGTRDNPTKQQLEALSRFFGVPIGYFLDDEVARQVAAQVHLLAALRDARISGIALRASELPPEACEQIATLIEHAADVQRTASGRGGRRGTPGRGAKD